MFGLSVLSCTLSPSVFRPSGPTSVWVWHVRRAPVRGGGRRAGLQPHSVLPEMSLGMLSVVITATSVYGMSCVGVGC